MITLQSQLNRSSFNPRTKTTNRRNSPSSGPTESPSSSSSVWPPPCQTYLTCYVDLVGVIVERLASASKFTKSDFEQFARICDKLLAMPVLNNDYSSFVILQVDNNLTPLQTTCLNTIRTLIKLYKPAASDTPANAMFVTLIFERLLSFFLYACYNGQPAGSGSSSSSTSGNANGASSSSAANGQPLQQQQQRLNTSGGKYSEVIAVNFVSFGERALLMATGLYDETAHYDSLIDKGILRAIIQTLYVPLAFKYACPSASTWRLSVDCLFKVMRRALPIVFKAKQTAAAAAAS